MSYLRNTEKYPKLMEFIEVNARDFKQWDKLDQKDTLNFDKFWAKHQETLFPLIMEEFTDNIDLNEAASDDGKSFHWGLLTQFLQSSMTEAQFAMHLKHNVLKQAKGYVEMLWEDYEEHLFDIGALEFIPEDQIIYGISPMRGVYDAAR